MPEKVKTLRELFDSLPAYRRETQAEISGVLAEATRLQHAAQEVARSFSGSWLPQFHDLYFEDFSPPPADKIFGPMDTVFGAPPSGWRNRSADEVRDWIEERSDASIQGVKERSANLTLRLQEHLQDVLDTIHGNGSLNAERSALGSFDFDVEEPLSDHVNHSRPPQEVGTIDQLAQGTRMPPHIAYEMTAYHAELQCQRARDYVQALRGLERQLRSLVDDAASDNSNRGEPMPVADPKKASRVFVVHGRNVKVRDAMFTFLRSLGLKPMEWDQAVHLSDHATPYVGDVLEAAFGSAQASVILFTGDDEARLRAEFLREADPPHERDLTPQARPNVLFEAGMAFATHDKRTILVEFGELRPFSDVWGRHVIRFDGSPEKRATLRSRLISSGCAVEEHGADWLTAGDFALDNGESKERIGPPEPAPQPEPPRLLSDHEILSAIHNRHYDDFRSFSDNNKTRSEKIFVPVDIQAIADELGVDADSVFGRLYYDLEKRYGYENDDGTTVHFFTLAVRDDSHCINFPLLEAVLAREERTNKKKTP